jgi:glycerol-3-phosphate acyltransferase PlsY
MMNLSISLGVLLLSYLIGSVPFGLIVVRVVKGQDIRKLHSGRTGGTNAMRAGGFWVGLTTSLLDIVKGASGAWIAYALLPGSVWLRVFAPLAVIIGHNYSIFLINRDENGKLKIGGGAGGAPCVGGSVGLWAPSFFIIFPIGFLVLFGIGYASVATMSVALASSVLFAILAIFKLTPWQFVVYGLLAEILLIWSLRPNIRRLLDGTERLVGWRAKRLEARERQ